MALTKVNSVGIATGISLTGITTTQDAKVGTGITLSPDGDGYYTGIITATSYRGDVSNCTGVGQTNFIDAESLSVSGISTLTGQATVGTGITLSPDGDVFFTGVVTATSYAGDGSGLTGIAATDNVRTGILDVAGVGTFRDNVNVADRIIHVGDTNTQIRFPTADTVTVETGGSERARIDSGGRLLIATTDIDSVSDGEVSKLIVKSTDSTASATFVRHSADAGGSGIYIGKSRNATVGSNTIVQSGDELGRITFSGDDGTNINTLGARIQAFVDGTPGENDMPGRLTFSTTADGAASVTERLRIDSSGRLHTGYTSGFGSDQVNILSSDGGGVSVAQQNVGNAGAGTTIGSYSFQGYHSGGQTFASAEARISAIVAATHSATAAATDLAFYTKPAATGPGSSPTEALRITSTGAVTLGTSSAATSSKLTLAGTDATNYITLKNTTASDSSGARKSIIVFQGTRSGGEVTDLVHLAGQHDGGSDNDWGAFRVLVNNGSGVTERFGIGQGGEVRVNAQIGSSGQVLQSAGGGSPAVWANASAGIEIAHQWRVTADATGNQIPITSWELVDTYGGGGFGSAMSESSGIFTFPTTGFWLIGFQMHGDSDNHTQNLVARIDITTDNSSYQHASRVAQGIYDYNNSYPSHAALYCEHIFDVTNTTTHKVRFTYGAGQGGERVRGSGSYTYTGATFIRLGDT